MKKIILIALLFVVAFKNTFAQNNPYRTVLTIHSADRHPILVTIDGRRFDHSGVDLRFSNIPVGMHRIKIYEIRGYGKWYSGNLELVYKGAIRIEENQRNDFEIDAERSQLYAVNIPNNEYPQHHNNFDNHHENNGYGHQETPNEGNNEHQNNSNNHEENSGNNNGYNIANVLSVQDMTDLHTRIDGKITDSDKIKLFQTVLPSKNYTTEQIGQMLQWLSFESSKLELAKLAYKNVVDRSNYWKLESQFSFSNTKEEFQQFIKS